MNPTFLAKLKDDDLDLMKLEALVEQDFERASVLRDEIERRAAVREFARSFRYSTPLLHRPTAFIVLTGLTT